MEPQVMTRPQIPRRGITPKKNFLLSIPLKLWERMLKEGGVSWGTTTSFILEAITEKLDRMKENKKQHPE